MGVHAVVEAYLKGVLRRLEYEGMSFVKSAAAAALSKRCLQEGYSAIALKSALLLLLAINFESKHQSLSFSSHTSLFSSKMSLLLSIFLPFVFQTRNAGVIRTRFPPEPNGYLHIGHAKSMNMNFNLAFEKLGVAPANRKTIFRYDDTNPEAESREYIDSIAKDIKWLGWQEEKTTYSSENFSQLHAFAVQLIKQVRSKHEEHTHTHTHTHSSLSLSKRGKRERDSILSMIQTHHSIYCLAIAHHSLSLSRISSFVLLHFFFHSKMKTIGRRLR
jgi:hypothetical protein